MFQSTHCPRRANAPCFGKPTLQTRQGNAYESRNDAVFGEASATTFQRAETCVGIGAPIAKRDIHANEFTNYLGEGPDLLSSRHATNFMRETAQSKKLKNHFDNSFLVYDTALFPQNLDPLTFTRRDFASGAGAGGAKNVGQETPMTAGPRGLQANVFAPTVRWEQYRQARNAPMREIFQRDPTFQDHVRFMPRIAAMESMKPQCRASAPSDSCYTKY